MESRYLYKAKRKDNGEWVTGYYFKAGEKHLILSFYTNEHGLYHVMYEIDLETVCQCTGLTDKNGKLIWENDIVRCGCSLIVKWNEKFASWCLTKKGWAHNHFFGEACEPEDCKVIGSIFDNPELLEWQV